MIRKLARAVSFLLATMLVVGVPAPAMAAGPTIVGAGSTWSQIAIDQWRADVYRYGLQINYQGLGSTTGRSLFIGGSVDFAVSEIPFQPEDGNVPRKYKYLPIVAGGTSLMYNLHSASGAQIRNLQLSSQTITQIFTGVITNWSDSRITHDYGAALPNSPIKIVVRSDGSGTSAQFTAYMAAMQPTLWRNFAAACNIPDRFTSFFPYGSDGCLLNAIAQKGSDGIANYVANPGLGVGAIGYVEAGYAIGRRFPIVALKNQSGHFVYPTAQNVATALTHVTLNPDSTENLARVYVAPEANAYPMSSYSYMIVPTDSSISPDKGAVLGKFINYFACAGQQAAARLGYSPLPKTLIQFAFTAEKSIPGAPTPPAITYSSCANPTLAGNLGSGATNGPPPGSGGTVLPPPPVSPAPGTGGGNNNGGTGVPGPTIPGAVVTITQTPQVLSDAALVGAKVMADEQIGAMHPANTTPLILGVGMLLLAVFGPLLALRVFGRRSRRVKPSRS